MPTYPVPSYSQEEVDDAILAAFSAAEKDIAAAQKAWQGSKAQTTVKASLASLPPDAKEYLKQREPDAFAEVFRTMYQNKRR